jgi:hypothetical protein
MAALAAAVPHTPNASVQVYGFEQLFQLVRITIQKLPHDKGLLPDGR